MNVICCTLSYIGMLFYRLFLFTIHQKSVGIAVNMDEHDLMGL